MARRLRHCEILAVVIGSITTLVHAGFTSVSVDRVRELNLLTFAAILLFCGCRLARLFFPGRPTRDWSSSPPGQLLLPGIWLLGIIGILPFGRDVQREHAALWTEMVFAAIATFTILRGCRRLAARTHNSAVLLVGSFLVTIVVGTFLLHFPVCRQQGDVLGGAPWNVALFTATSASCVTGLVVEPTGSYWSPVGHTVIFTLFQIGGLGILTFGAFMAVLSGRQGLEFREARTLQEMLDTDSVRNARLLLVTILLMTFSMELVGGLLLMGLWPDLPLSQRFWHGLFHAVSAFCNAGFSLSDDGFLNQATHWQIWGPLTLLIILGGLGFSVIQDVWLCVKDQLTRQRESSLFARNRIPRRLTVHSRLVLRSTIGLLLVGAIAWFGLESLTSKETSVTRLAADAWFQSVTFRTAGFHTVDHATMNPATRLMAIVLMFIGAAPGSTGGGVKTVVFAVTMLNIVAVMKGRDRVEVFGRRIPSAQVARALAMIAVGLMLVLGTTGLLIIFERQPDRFLDHLFEATSAFGTVGVSTGITSDLSLPSRLLITVVMFLGRVGPITLLLAMSSSGDAHRYDYPEESVSLG